MYSEVLEVVSYTLDTHTNVLRSSHSHESFKASFTIRNIDMLKNKGLTRIYKPPVCKPKS
jgi:hypothetical protein